MLLLLILEKHYLFRFVFFVPIFSCGPISSGSSRVFYNIGKHDVIAVAGLGNSVDWDELENVNGRKENVRIAAAGNLIYLFLFVNLICIQNQFVVLF